MKKEEKRERTGVLDRPGGEALPRKAFVFLLSSLALFSFPALALPPAGRLQLAPGDRQTINTLFRVDSVLVDPPGLVTATAKPFEVRIAAPPNGHGSGLVLAVGWDRVAAWDVCVSADGTGCPAETKIDTAKSACPTLHVKTDDDQPVWTAKVKTRACFLALRQALSHAQPQGALEFTLDEAVADDFFRDVEQAIARDPACAGLTAGYYGATLNLSGNATQDAVDHALLDAYKLTVGHVSFDDSDIQEISRPKLSPPPSIVPPQKSTPKASPDAGAPAQEMP